MTFREQVLAAANDLVLAFEEADARGEALLKRAEDAESALEEMKDRLLRGDINVMLGNGDMVDAGWTRQLDANNKLHATLVRAEKAERELVGLRAATKGVVEAQEMIDRCLAEPNSKGIPDYADMNWDKRDRALVRAGIVDILQPSDGRPVEVAEGLLDRLIDSVDQEDGS